MTIGVVGRKCGMTRIFTEEGVSIPVTVIEIEPNRVTQFKTEETDGYRAVQVTVGERRASRVTAAQAGHFAKANVAAGRTANKIAASLHLFNAEERPIVLFCGNRGMARRVKEILENETSYASDGWETGLITFVLVAAASSD